MTSVPDALDGARDHVEHAVREASPAVRALARLGFVSKGVVYIIVGLLAAHAAISSGQPATDQQGALRTILHQPFGRTMLFIGGVGLFGFALWRLIQAILDPEDEVGTRPKEVARRIARFVSGVAYAALGVAAWQLAFTGVDRGEEGRAEEWTALLMAQPAGAWLAGIVGLVIIGVGLWHLYQAWRIKLGDKLVLDRWGARMRTWIIRFGRAGYAARGVVFCLIGIFLVAAARQHNPSEAKGVAESLRHLQGMNYGWVILAVIALGLIAYGLFELVEARYRKIEVC